MSDLCKTELKFLFQHQSLPNGGGGIKVLFGESEGKSHQMKSWEPVMGLTGRVASLA